jgi:8-oxo-dGTP pyrophosphatase MutT (NUDIX family)
MANGTSFIRQAAAIPVRGAKICLITSSNGKRWVIPKGLIETNQTAAECALQEAWEEAGLVGRLGAEPVGSYLYDKYGGTCHVTVFVMRVTEVASEWPERDLRQRSWLGLPGALERIEDPGLYELLQAALGKGAREKLRLGSGN